MWNTTDKHASIHELAKYESDKETPPTKWYKIKMCLEEPLTQMQLLYILTWNNEVRMTSKLS